MAIDMGMPTMCTQAAFHVGPGWAPVGPQLGPKWAPGGPDWGPFGNAAWVSYLTSGCLGILPHTLDIFIATIANFYPKCGILYINGAV